MRLLPVKTATAQQAATTKTELKPPFISLLPKPSCESSNEEDVHNNSSKTIIDLIQPNKVKLKHLNEVSLAKDSLNTEDLIHSFNKHDSSFVFPISSKSKSSIFNRDIIENERISVPPPSMLNVTSKNMNYDHRKYTNLGAIKYSNHSISYSRENDQNDEQEEMDEDLMDSFEARMLQEMKAEMESDKPDNKKGGSNTSTTTSGIGTKITSTTSKSILI
jgi:hypothetical protein